MCTFDKHLRHFFSFSRCICFLLVYFLFQIQCAVQRPMKATKRWLLYLIACFVSLLKDKKKIRCISILELYYFELFISIIIQNYHFELAFANTVHCVFSLHLECRYNSVSLQFYHTRRFRISTGKHQ